MSAALAAGLTLAAPAAAPAAGPNAADPGPTRAEVVVEDEVRLELAGGGETDFWVYLSDEPELGPASGIADRGPRSVAPQVRASDVHGVAVDGG